MLVTSANSKLHACKSGNSKILKEKVFTDVSFYRTYAQASALVTSTDSIALIVRHSQKAGNGDAHLSTKGEEWAIEQGEVLSNLPTAFKNDVKYYSTNINRTKETAIKLSYGMTGTAITENDIDLSLADGILRSNYYLRGTNPGNPDWTLLSKYAYNIVTGADALTAEQLMNNFGTTPQNNLEKVNLYTSEIINGILSNMTHKTNIFITHDNMLGPFVITVTGMTIDMDYYQNSDAEWVNYISGILLIKHVDGSFECIPIHTPYNDSDIIFTKVSTSYSLTEMHNHDKILAKSLSTDKIVYMIRHAEKDNNNDEITTNGVNNSISFGNFIKDGTIVNYDGQLTIDAPANNAKYFASCDRTTEVPFVRTQHTAQAIAVGREDTDFDESDYSEIDTESLKEFIFAENFVANPDALVSGESFGTLQTKYCYHPENLTSDQLSRVFNTTEADAWTKICHDADYMIQHILQYCTARVNFIICNDRLLQPMIAYLSNKTFIINAPSNVGYLQGVAMIVHSDNTFEMVAVELKH